MLGLVQSQVGAAHQIIGSGLIVIEIERLPGLLDYSLRVVRQQIGIREVKVRIDTFRRVAEGEAFQLTRCKCQNIDVAVAGVCRDWTSRRRDKNSAIARGGVHWSARAFHLEVTISRRGTHATIGLTNANPAVAGAQVDFITRPLD